MSKLRSSRRADAGFTLPELLVAIVVLSLIIGAIAQALITMLDNNAAPSARFSDSVNAQITGTYFVRDVQGASAVTTDQTLYSSGSYSITSPQVCGPASGAGTLLVAFYRPAGSNGTASSPALDVGYWLQGTGTSSEIDRYACSLNSTTFASTQTSIVAMATPPPGTITGNNASILSVKTDITPTQFATTASGHWTPVSSYTITVGATTLSTTGSVMKVASTVGFTTSGSIVLTVTTTQGAQTVTCTGTSTYTVNSVSLPEFTGCTVTSGSYTVAADSPVTQANISGIQTTVSEPASSYQYNLLGTPLVGSAVSTAPPGNGPTLLTLGADGLSLNGTGSNSCLLDPLSNSAKICVNGNILVDGGVVSCGTGGVYATGGIETAGSGSCNGSTIPQTAPIGDPLLGVLPPCFDPVVSLPTYADATAGQDASNYEKPGIYTGTLSGTLEPGVYVIEGGIGTVSMAPLSSTDTYFKENAGSTYDSTSGALLYFPGPSGAYGAGSACWTEPTSTVYGVGAAVSLAPLDSSQSSYYFGTTGVGGLWAWQDATNSTGLSLSGNINVCSGNAYGSSNATYNSQCGNTSGTATSAQIYGMGYFPAADFSASGNPGMYMGRLEVAGYNPGSGTPYVDLTGAMASGG
jgi:prepilin-type N-terminal cleavage/methylation domain-containing protein